VCDNLPTKQDMLMCVCVWVGGWVGVSVATCLLICRREGMHSPMHP